MGFVWKRKPCFWSLECPLVKGVIVLNLEAGD